MKEKKMAAVVWTMKDCPNCEKAKEMLKMANVSFEERNAEGLTNGDEFNPKAVKFFAAQRFAAPLVCFDENFVKIGDLENTLKGLKK
jgi:glutaredoxin